MSASSRTPTPLLPVAVGGREPQFEPLRRVGPCRQRLVWAYDRIMGQGSAVVLPGVETAGPVFRYRPGRCPTACRRPHFRDSLCAVAARLQGHGRRRLRQYWPTSLVASDGHHRQQAVNLQQAVTSVPDETVATSRRSAGSRAAGRPRRWSQCPWHKPARCVPAAPRPAPSCACAPAPAAQCVLLRSAPMSPSVTPSSNLVVHHRVHRRVQDTSCRSMNLSIRTKAHSFCLPA